MALSVTKLDQTVAGNKRFNSGLLALDNSYPAGGYPISANLFGLGVMDTFDPGSRGGYVIEWDKANGTLRVYHGFTLTGGQAIGTPIQASAGILGKTQAGNITVTSSAPVEVPTGTDLSGVTNLSFRAIGV